MPEAAAAAPAPGSPNVSPPATGPAPAPGTPSPSPGVPAPAVAPDAQGQPSSEYVARIAALEKQLADVEALDPLLQVLSQHPDVVQRMVVGSYDWGDSASPQPAAAAAAAPEGGGEYQDPRVAMLMNDVKELRRQNDDFMLEVGMARGAREFGDAWDRKAVLKQIAHTGVTDPIEAYYAIHGRKMTPDYIKAQIAEGVKSELASRAAAASPSPAGVAGQAGGQPEATTPGPGGQIGPALREMIEADAKDGGMAPNPFGEPETE